MQAVESSIIAWYPEMSEAWSQLHPRGLLSSDKPGATFTHFPENPDIYIIRRDNGNPSTVINVFTSDGTQVYTIERYSANATLWTLYKSPSREQVAAIRCGVLQRSVFFSGKPGIQSRTIGNSRMLYGGLPDRKFHLSDGAPYEWTRESQYLERIINPGGGREETRQRVAMVRLLRQWRFEWELLVDKQFDCEIALATAFISMLTAWTTFQPVIPGSRS